MDKQLLIRANKLIHNRRPDMNETQACEATPVEDMLELSFASKQCRNDKAGICTMCDYGRSGNQWSEEDYIDSLKTILNNDLHLFKSIHISTNGSMMDEYQISTSLFQRIINELSLCSIPEIGIETHFRTVTNSKLHFLQQRLLGKKVYIEMGLETLHPQCLSTIIMKLMIPEDLSRTVDMVQRFGFTAVLNVIFGMPFMNAKEQMEDTEKTLHWVFQRQCRAVVFPINIKPYTLLSHIYRTGFYQPVSHWLLILLLDYLPITYLSNITVAYYGNRNEDYQNVKGRTVFPICCKICKPLLIEFYQLFNTESNADGRKLLLQNLLEKISCDCLTKEVEKLESCSDDTTFIQRYLVYEDLLRSKLSRGELLSE